MGRVCVHPCEGACKRGQLEGAISIAALKRFAADQVPETVHPWTPKGEDREKVAIIGSGPAGLSCAYYLALEGYCPRSSKRCPSPAGCSATAFLPTACPRRSWTKRSKTSAPSGWRSRPILPSAGTSPWKSLTEQELQSYLPQYWRPGQPQASGTLAKKPKAWSHGVDYLRNVNLGLDVPTGRKVGIVGGGNVAMDAARTLIRTGAEVHVFYRRSRSGNAGSGGRSGKGHGGRGQVPLPDQPHRSPDGGRPGAGSPLPAEMELGPPDASGRRQPVPIAGSEFDVEIDMLIPAIGQTVLGEALLEAGVAMEHGTIKVDPVTLAANLPGVFAGGDAVPRTPSCRRCYRPREGSGHLYSTLSSGEDLTLDRRGPKPAADLGRFPGVSRKSLMPIPELPPMERIQGMEEVHGGYSPEEGPN